MSKEPKCKTCGDKRQIPIPCTLSLDVPSYIPMKPCPDCQQPTVREFTKDLREIYGDFKCPSGRIVKGHTLVLELCDRLDTAEAEKKDLLEALEEASSDFYYIHQHPEDAHVDSYNFMEKVNQAKAKKEKEKEKYMSKP